MSGNRIRMVSTDDTISILCGMQSGASGMPLFGILCAGNYLSAPRALFLQESLSVMYFSLTETCTIHAVDLVTNLVSTVAGNGQCATSFEPGFSLEVSLVAPNAIVATAYYVTSILVGGFGVIYSVDLSSGDVNLVAGSGSPSSPISGSVIEASSVPVVTSLVVDEFDNIYFSGEDYYIAMIDLSLNSMLWRVVGNDSVFGELGNTTDTFFAGSIPAIFYDRYTSTLYWAARNCIWKAELASSSSSSILSYSPTIATTVLYPTLIPSAPTVPPTSVQNSVNPLFSVANVVSDSTSSGGGSLPGTNRSVLGGMDIDTLGQLYIANYGTHRVFKVSVNGSVSAVAGTGVLGTIGMFYLLVFSVDLFA